MARTWGVSVCPTIIQGLKEVKKLVLGNIPIPPEALVEEEALEKSRKRRGSMSEELTESLKNATAVNGKGAFISPLKSSKSSTTSDKRTPGSVFNLLNNLKTPKFKLSTKTVAGSENTQSSPEGSVSAQSNQDDLSNLTKLIADVDKQSKVPNGYNFVM